MTDHLAAFLRARYDETAAKAEAARGDGDGRWRQDDAERYPGRIVDSAGGIVTFDEGAPDEEQAEHIVCHDPARVLADIDAKRRLLGEHPPGLGYDGHATNGTVCRTCAQDSHDGGLTGDPFPCATLRLLALPYADHPDYRPEWRPQA